MTSRSARPRGLRRLLRARRRGVAAGRDGSILVIVVFVFVVFVVVFIVGVIIVVVIIVVIIAVDVDIAVFLIVDVVGLVGLCLGSIKDGLRVNFCGDLGLGRGGRLGFGTRIRAGSGVVFSWDISLSCASLRWQSRRSIPNARKCKAVLAPKANPE
ncbi:hypothetical protein QWZ10_11920 [Paracoccus cavernae]|uniref:Uncharacterized protein n=1 Tax=Paracoccus cavernae TaxID=1571207 RepID=A0ABT8D8X2_9RHOB|nr:hypothetical protein [Paracoccus cavernae]